MSGSSDYTRLSRFFFSTYPKHSYLRVIFIHKNELGSPLIRSPLIQLQSISTHGETRRNSYIPLCVRTFFLMEEAAFRRPNPPSSTIASISLMDHCLIFLGFVSLLLSWAYISSGVDRCVSSFILLYFSRISAVQIATVKEAAYYYISFFLNTPLPWHPRPTTSSKWSPSLVVLHAYSPTAKLDFIQVLTVVNRSFLQSLSLQSIGT